MEDKDLRLEIMKKFDSWFKQTEFFNGENCSPKYETYRMLFNAYFNGFKDFRNIYLDESYIDNYDYSVIPPDCLAYEIIYDDEIFN